MVTRINELMGVSGPNPPLSRGVSSRACRQQRHWGVTGALKGRGGVPRPTAQRPRSSPSGHWLRETVGPLGAGVCLLTDRTAWETSQETGILQAVMAQMVKICLQCRRPGLEP